MSKDLERTTTSGPVTREQAPDDRPKPGQWYWIDGEDHNGKKYRWFGCVVRVGSNYAKLEGPSNDRHDSHYEERIHLDAFAQRCTPEPDPRAVIMRKIAEHRVEFDTLLGEAREIAETLGLSGRALAQGEVQAIAVRTSDTAPKEYKAALVKAKDKTLPAIFEQVEEHARKMGQWMKAETLPLHAEAGAMRRTLKRIEGRILNIELYAGIVEQVHQVADGQAAPFPEPIRLMQRMHFMDEECLVAYEAGGMTFRDVPAFDRWMARPENRDRLLPFPRCIIAMRVRRETKDRSDMDLGQFIALLFSGQIAADKATFLYLRNGEQVWRLRTGIEFGEKLFPDLTPDQMTGQIYVHDLGHSGERLATEGEYLDALRQHDLDRLEGEAWAMRMKERRIKQDDWHKHGVSYFLDSFGRDHYSYQKFSREDVHYDEMADLVHLANEHHNRLALVLQGLLDRSPVFHPHPKWSIWTDAGFAEALRLVHDDTRALVPGAAPDFEAYRRRLNGHLKAGCVTVGQEVAWWEREAERYNRAMRENWRVRDHRDVRHHVPEGDPGPGMLATVVRMSGGRCTFEWTRKKRTARKVWEPNPERPGWGWDRRVHDDTKGQIAVRVPRLLNVSAYRPGDFRQFYADPRTRADYLKWAPLMLAAEEWHAGNRTGSPKSRR